ncbi:MAG: hypothetical protein ABIG61_05375 [Planctomycetota bacterium]
MPIRLEKKSKGQLKEGVEKRRRSLDKGEKGIGNVVKEKKELAKVSHELRYPTKEGAAEIKKALAKSAEAMNKEFKKKNKDLKEIHKKCKDAEIDFKGRTGMAEKNAEETRKTKGRMKETHDAKPYLDRAELAAKKDAAFTKEYEGKQRRRRERSITCRNELNTQLMNTMLKL